jgi:3-isopropylmalate/(R)-2-methylmalate dehydratase small subunit
VIAPSFGDIFRGNAYNNGLLPVVLPAEAVRALGEGIERENDKRLRVDLGAQRIEPPGGGGLGFGIDPARRAALMEGLDEIGLTLRQAEAIAGFQARDREERPWIHAVGDNTKEREETSP